MSRRRISERDDFLRREARRRDWEAREAMRWLVDNVPDDRTLRPYVAAVGHLLLVQRQIHRWEREADKRLTAAIAARESLREAENALADWRDQLPALAIEVERARGEWRAEQFRREHEHADDLDTRRDHDAHVWEWYRNKWREP